MYGNARVRAGLFVELPERQAGEFDAGIAAKVQPVYIDQRDRPANGQAAESASLDAATTR